MNVALERNANQLVLRYQQPEGQRNYTNIYGLVMIVVALFMIIYAAWMWLADPSTMSIALFFLAGGAFAIWNAAVALLDQDCTTTFDLTAKTVTSVETGWIAKTRGPVAFGEISALYSKIGFVGRRRAAIAQLQLTDGTVWQLGYEDIWVRPEAERELPALVAEIQEVTGLAEGEGACSVS